MLFSNPILWSLIGFWILIAGLIGEGIVLVLVPASKLEKLLNLVCIFIIIIGIAVAAPDDPHRDASP